MPNEKHEFVTGEDRKTRCPTRSSKDSSATAHFDYDLIVVGGGSAGFAAAIQAQTLGAKVVLINAGMIGGTCVNVGCVPSKTLIRAVEEVHRASSSRFMGIESTSRIADFTAIIRQKDELVESLRQAKYIDVLNAYDNIELVEGRATMRTADTVEVGNCVIRAPKIIIATGSRPWIPPIAGLREAGPLTSTSAFELESLPSSLIVLGGRYVALECAQMFARMGSCVTMLQRSDHILPTEDNDITEALTDYLREEGIQIETNVKIEEISRDGQGVTVRAQVGGRVRAFEAEHILCATGRRPVTDGFGLKKIGIHLGEDGRIKVDDHLQTSVQGIFAAGDVIGKPAFVYTAAYEGNLAAVNALATEQGTRDYIALPWVIFTDPQLAGVGLNEKGAAAAGLEVEVSHLDLSYVPRAIAARDTRGFIKLLKERGGDRLLGARILAPEGGEQIMEAVLAIRHMIGVSELANAFHPYLTQAEGIKLCAQGFEKDVRKLSCCSA